MTAIDLFLITGATAGIALGLFFSIVLFRTLRVPPYSNQILALLLCFLSLRIGKSVFYNFLELPVAIKNFGLACNLAVGPLLLFYGRSLWQKAFRVRSLDLLHFIPAAIYFVLASHIPNDPTSSQWKASYSLILFQAFVYVGASAYLLRCHFKAKDAKASWYRKLIVGLAALWLVYLLIFVGAIPVYLAGAFSFTLLVALLGYWTFDRRSFHAPVFHRKYQASTLEEGLSKGLMQKVRRLLNEEQLFLDAGLTLDQLAQKAGTTSKTLSQAINENTGRNFAHLINSYRVEYARKLFAHPGHRKEKVIAIALQSGFNSLSSFNSVFKKYTGMTPTQCRKSFPNS